VAGTYAEPGSQSYRTDLASGKDVARCRYCGAEISLHTSPNRAREWRHTETDEARCGVGASRLNGVA
jgi:hypothetical protein